MQCAICNFRAPIGYCNECKELVCELCAVECKQCGKLVCREHRMATKKGDSVCISCLAERSSGRATSMARDRREEEVAVEELALLSNESLIDEMDDEEEAIAMARARRRARERKRKGQKDDDDAPRILHESAPSRIQMWITTLWGTGGSVGLLIMLFVWRGNAWIQGAIPYLCYVTLTVSIGTIIWGAYGLLLKKGIGMGHKRWFCVLGIVISLIVALLAFGVLNEPPRTV